MMLTSSLIILALSFFTIASAAVLPRQLRTCFEAFELNDPSANLPIPAIVNANDNGAWKMSDTVGATVASIPNGGDKIRVAVAVNDPTGKNPLVRFVLESNHNLAVAVGDGVLVTANLDESASDQMFRMDCNQCAAVDQPAPVDSTIGDLCQFTPAVNPNNVCVASGGNEVTVVPCAGSRSNDQLFNLVVI